MLTSKKVIGINAQKGAVLIISLLILVLMTIIGVTAMQGTTLQEKMTGNLRDSNLAFQYAETALRAGELYLQGSGTKLFTNSGGLYLPTPAAQDPWKPRWLLVDWSNSTAVKAYSGNLGSYVSANPKYIIEDLGLSSSSNDFTTLKSQLPPPESRYYRVTSRATGGSSQAVVMLQTIYKN